MIMKVSNKLATNKQEKPWQKRMRAIKKQNSKESCLLTKQCTSKG